MYETENGKRFLLLAGIWSNNKMTRTEKEPHLLFGVFFGLVQSAHMTEIEKNADNCSKYQKEN